MDKEHKVLIVATQPYRKDSQSRTYDSYFRHFKKESLMQIYSDSLTPPKGHCSIFYQITDKRLVKRRFFKTSEVGKVYLDGDLSNENAETRTKHKKFTPLYRGPIYRFLRKYVWKKKYWDDVLLEKTVNSFAPNCIFLCVSKDFFIFDIALHFANKYKIPIVLCVSDDYFFFDEYKFHLLNHAYRKRYLSVVAKVIERTVLGIFCSDKIKEKYTKELGIKGETIYLSSEISPKRSSGIDLSNDWYYFGNLEFGRLKALRDIGDCLHLLKSNIKLHIYSKDVPSLKSWNPNIIFHRPIPYGDLIRTMSHAGALIVVEDFAKKHVNMTRYSLSTKIADCLCSGVPVIAYGPKEAGAIGFLSDKAASYVATSKKELYVLVSKLLNGFNDQTIYDNQYETAINYFDVDVQSERFLSVIKAIDENPS